MILQKFTLAAIAAVAFTVTALPSSADTVLFDFNNGTALDDVAGGLPLPANFAAIGVGGTTVNLTVTSAFAPEFVVDPADPAAFVATGNTIAASTGIRSNALGVDNLTLPGGNEGGDIQDGESFTFEFDQDVTLDNLDIASLGVDGFLTLTIGAFSLDINDGDFASNEFLGFTETDGSAQVIAAGTDITIAGTSVAADGSVSIRITDLTVTTVTSVPEPSSLLALVGMAGLFAVRRRR